MSKNSTLPLWAKLLFGFVGTFIIVTFFVATSFIGYRNEFVRMEKGIVAQYKDNQNTYDAMWKKFKEASQVTTMYADDLQKVFKDAIQARYENSTQVAMNWIKENNPNFDASMYTKLQAMIESGRNEFKQSQTMLTDKRRVYEEALEVFPSNIVASFSGFPRLDLAKYDIVTSSNTEKAFEEKKAEEIKLRN